jgi:hypothetical protein
VFLELCAFELLSSFTATVLTSCCGRRYNGVVYRYYSTSPAFGKRETRSMGEINYKASGALTKIMRCVRKYMVTVSERACMVPERMYSQ